MKKRLLCLCLALLLLLPTLIACDRGNVLKLIDKGQSNYRIIYAKGENDAAEAAQALAEAIYTHTGVLLEVLTDDEEATDTEILVGFTNRELSDELLRSLDGQKHSFAIAVDGKRVALVGTNGTVLHAAELFLSSLQEKLGGVCAEGSLSLPEALHYTGTVPFANDNVSLIRSTAQLALQKKGGELSFDEILSPQRLCAITSNGTDYYAVVKTINEDEAQVHQYSVGGTLQSSSVTLSLGMAVSACYNPLTEQIVIAHGGNDATKLSVLSPTLALERTVQLDAEVGAIAYLPGINRYLVKLKNENVCYLLDGAFCRDGAPISLPRAAASATVRDMTADDRYIYLLYSDCVLLVDRSSTRYQHLPLPFDAALRDVFSISLHKGSFIFGAQPITGGNNDEEPLPKLLTASLAQTAPDAAPGDLFTEELRKEVDTTGLSNTKLFDTYKIANSPSGNTVMQGGCTDGKYGYFCMENQAGNYSNTYLHNTRIVKVDLATNTLAAVSDPLPLHHSNDMCYNALTGQLVVAHNGKEQNVVSFVDPKTLKIVGTQILPYSIYSITHEPTTDRYVVGKSGGRNYAVLDGSFNVLIRHLDAGPYTYYTETSPITQGIDCDEKYIYSVLGVKYTETVDGTSKTLWRNFLVVHNWRGEYLFTKVLPGMTAESENVFHVGNTIYVGCNGGNDPVYRFDIGA